MTTINTNDSFAEALDRGDIARLADFPKAERHCHSIFGTSLQSIADWAGEPIKPPPARMANLDEMRSYAHSELYPLIWNRSGFEFTAKSAIAEAIQDGVSILEMSLDVAFVSFYNSGAIGFIDFVQELMRKHAKDLDFRPEIGVSKSHEPSSRLKPAWECIESGLFKSLDLYGNEHAQQPDVYADLFRSARSLGLKLKAHVGEFGGPELMERTLRVLELQEIQHGVTAATSKPLMDVLRREGIRLNVCPSSNVALSVVKDLAHHPIRILFENGIRVTINSDDKTIFGKSTSEEYLGLYQAGNLTVEELDQIRIGSLKD
jgi:adenosine deaminase